MPKLPDWTDLPEKTLSPAQRLVPIPTPDLSGYQRLGKAISDIGDTIGEQQQTRENYNAQVASLTQSNALDAATADLDPTDPNYAKKRLEAYDNVYAKPVLDRIKDPALKQKWQDQLFKGRIKEQGQVAQETRTVQRSMAKDEADKAIDAAMTQLLKPGADYDATMGTVLSVIENGPFTYGERKQRQEAAIQKIRGLQLDKAVETYGKRPDGVRDTTIVTDGQADIAKVDPTLMDRFYLLQGWKGRPLTLNSGYRSAKYNAEVGGADKSQHIEGKALDISTAGWSKQEIVDFVQYASSIGIGGIGIYPGSPKKSGSIHVDIGGRRAWGPSYGIETVPAWARPVIDAHLRNEFKGDIPLTKYNVEEVLSQNPAYQALDFDGRAKALSAARGYMKQVDDESERVASQNAALLKTYADSSLTSIEETGSPVAFDEASYLSGLKPPQQQEYLQKRQEAQDTYTLLEGLDKRKSGEFSEILDANQPEGGEPDFDARDRRYKKLQTRIKDIEEERRKDPASAADKSNMITGDVARSYAAKEPGSGPAMVRERLAVQEYYGVRPDLQKVLTSREAVDYAQPLMQLAKTPVKAIEDEDAASQSINQFIDTVWPELVDRYGQYADNALVQIIDTVAESQDRARALKDAWGAIVGGRMKGQNVDITNDEEMARFIEYSLVGDVMLNPRNSGGEVASPMVLRDNPVRIKPEAINYLRDNPGFANDFDLAYGSKDDPRPSQRYLASAPQQ